MHKTAFLSIRYLAASCAVSALAFALPSQAQPTQKNYQQDLQHCEALQGESRAACRREAGAALQAERQNKLEQPNPAMPSNRTARCDRLPLERQQECQLTMQEGQETTVSGSVQGGGILRETTITVPATAR